MSSSICGNCLSKPSYISPILASSPYCSRTCAGLNGATAKAHAAMKGLCQTCHAKPRFFDKNRNEYSPFCTRNCAGMNGKAATTGTSTISAAHVVFKTAIAAIPDLPRVTAMPLIVLPAPIQSTRVTTLEYQTAVPKAPLFVEMSTEQKKSYLAPLALQGKPIDFYDTKLNPFTDFLGNFFKAEIKLSRNSYPCAEALYQAAKFIDQNQKLDGVFNSKLLEVFNEVNLKKSKSFLQGASIGHAAWELGQVLNKSGINQRENWNSLNILIMENILRLKYDQNPQLAELLLQTGNCVLNERTDNDSFWGGGVLADGVYVGQNQLGQCHMRLRAEMQSNNSALRSVPKTLQEVLFVPHSETVSNE